MSNIKDKYFATKILYNSNTYKALAFFLNNPSGQFYDRQVSNLTNISPAGTNFALRDLAKAGLLQREEKGRMVFYSINQSCALIRPLKIMNNILKLNPLVGEIKKEAIRIVLYGSAAKGENREESDIDLFILTRSKEKIEKSLFKFRSENKIQFVLHTPQEWALLEKNNPVFVQQVEQGMILWENHEEGI